MLCEECHRHFDLASQDYSSVKETTVSELQLAGAPLDLLRFLQADLSTYRQFRDLGWPYASPWVPAEAVSAFLTEESTSSLTHHDLEIWKHGEPRKYIRRSAGNGCDMCLRIWEAVESLRFDIDLTDLESWLVLHPVTLRPIEVRILAENDHLETQHLRFELLERHSVFVRGLPTPSIGISSSEQSIGMLLDNLTYCFNNHSKCRDGVTASWLPTRLIDVYSLRATGRVKLIHRNEILPIRSSTETRYVTLSHIWGSHKFLTLMGSNIEDLRSGFSVSGLPETFKQAMQVTERIGLRYIWIDSLCIIQDSDSDWQVEASCMGKVYLNSFCTFAASLATSPDQGLFWSRRADLASPFEIEIVSTAGPARYSVFQDLQYFILGYAPLYKRGWVLQESYLSPRTLHFSKYPAFECRQMFASELYKTYDNELGPESTIRLYYSTKTMSRAQSRSYSSWYNIAYDYSRCDLTVPTDKLIALCGIAKALSPSIPGGYYAGIWGKWWLQGLLWAVDQWISGNEMAPIRPDDKYRAPTWSWTSVDAPIHPWDLSYGIKSVLVELQSISTTALNEDPFGQLSGGELVLKGKLFDLPRFRALAEVTRSDLAAFAFSLDDFRGDNWDNQTFFLPLVESLNYTSFDDLNICGLILQPANHSAGQARAFVRVGFAVVSKIDGGVALADHRVDNWTQPPWPEEQLELITII